MMVVSNNTAGTKLRPFILAMPLVQSLHSRSEHRLMSDCGKILSPTISTELWCDETDMRAKSVQGMSAASLKRFAYVGQSKALDLPHLRAVKEFLFALPDRHTAHDRVSSGEKLGNSGFRDESSVRGSGVHRLREMNISRGRNCCTI